MHKRIFALFVLILFLTPSVAFAQEGSAPATDSGGSAPATDSGGSGTSDSGSPTSSGGGGLGGITPDSGPSQPPSVEQQLGQLEQQIEQQIEQRCPQDMCMKGEDCVPCSGIIPPKPPQETQPIQERKFESCPPKPPVPCSPDQRAEPNFDERGCLINWRCMGVGTATGPINVPQGCKKVETEYSVQIVCEQDRQFSNLKADKEKSCAQSGGRFYVREDGSFDCSYESKSGFFQQGQCPTSEELNKVERECTSKGGFIEKFRDKNGCGVLSCREKFKQEFQNNEEVIKFKAIACEENGGQFVTDNTQGPQCIGGQQNIRVNKELKPLDGVALLKIALEMENIMQTFNQIADKLEALKNYYEQRGDTEKANSFSIALSQLNGALTRLDEIRIGLAENANSLQEQDRIKVIEDIQQMDSIIKDIAITLLTGGKSRRPSTPIQTTPQEKRVVSPQEADVQKAFQKCSEFTKDNPYTLEPERGTTLQLMGLDNGRCVMTVHSKQIGEGITFKLPAEVYQFFDNPQLLLREDVECSPELACNIIKEKLKSGEVGPTQRPTQLPQTERFGERERKIKYGIEYGILGCNDIDSGDKLNQGCSQQGEIACEIEVPGCGNWIVCASSQDKCPPRDYCKLKPEACPGPSAREEDEFEEDEFEKFRGPEFPEPQNRFKRLQQEFPSESRPSSGELRPSQCDDVGFTNEECAKWAVENLNAAGQGPCIGLDKEQCVSVLKKSWDRAFENRGFASNAVKEISQFIRGE